MKKTPEDLIPEGMYCYKAQTIDFETGRIKIKVCPYWSFRKTKPAQENGYCKYLKKGDWQIRGISLLWDQVKECGIKMDWPEDEQKPS